MTKEAAPPVGIDLATYSNESRPGWRYGPDVPATAALGGERTLAESS
jgi:hypothetical protein